MSPIDPRTLTPTQVGTRLRDAAVDPAPGDFLPPTNAGEPGELGNPHGPTVVSPEIHGSAGIRPGTVSDTPATQSQEETEFLHERQPQTAPTPDPEPDPEP